MEKLFIDTDIILDLLTAREPFYEYAATLFSLADNGKVSLHFSSLSFSNLNYMLSKQYSAAQARKLLSKFKTIVKVLAVDEKITELALSSDFKDFEDALQYYTAIANNIKMLVTRNLKDYKHADIPVMTAEQYLRSV
jgi:predicted nucleic acid-binding protein